MKIIEIILTEFEKLNMHILNCGDRSDFPSSATN